MNGMENLYGRADVRVENGLSAGSTASADSL
jgi:hypothetical protein